MAGAAGRFGKQRLTTPFANKTAITASEYLKGVPAAIVDTVDVTKIPGYSGD